MKRVHVLVVGPGLSRDRRMLQCAEHAIEKAKSLDMPIVIDAVSSKWLWRIMIRVILMLLDDG